MRLRTVIPLSVLVLSSCIRNDLDYPLVFGGFTSFTVADQKGVKIDNDARKVTVDLEEWADRAHLKYLSSSLTEGASLSEPIPSELDLTQPYDVTIKTWQTYGWKIESVQTIERYVRCRANQVGNASFNEETRTVILNVTEDQPLTAIEIVDMKLGPEGARIVSTTGYERNGVSTDKVTRECSFPMTLECVLDRTFTVEFMGKTEDWIFKAVQVTVDMEIQSVVPWCHKADVRAVFGGKGSPVLEYRKASEQQWTAFSGAEISGVGISGTITGLQEDTEYMLRVTNGGESSTEVRFKTDSPVQLPNMDFDTWSMKGKVWNPYPAGATPENGLIWDTANAATAAFLGNVTTPEENFVAVEGPGKKAVKMESTYAVVNFAAGNIFMGQFMHLRGLGAELEWGYPFSSKPQALHGYYSYRPAVCKDADADHQFMLGKDDIGQIQFLLTDWPERFLVLSAERKYVDFDNDPGIIAYTEKAIDESTDGYVEFTLPLVYRSFRTPRYVIVIACASYYGNYFTGGRGSVLYVDEFSFVYD